MPKFIKKLFESSSDLQAMLRPFRRPHKLSRISPDNKIVNAYIYDWDNRISEKNSIEDADITIISSAEEGENK
ncbi:MAG: hypothetical protein GXO85_08590 [Chlorobi bacterium]|nr:hypothetical protein [Chlorobiota bacterium]